jgi:hypothetical protein
MTPAATASVGDSTAPRTNAACQDIPWMTAWATTATATVVTTTRPTDSSVIGPRLARRSRSEEKNAAAYSSGGRKIRRTRSGLSPVAGTPGRKPITAPPHTSRMGYGTPVR